MKKKNLINKASFLYKYTCKGEMQINIIELMIIYS